VGASQLGTPLRVIRLTDFRITHEERDSDYPTVKVEDSTLGPETNGGNSPSTAILLKTSPTGQATCECEFFSCRTHPSFLLNDPEGSLVAYHKPACYSPRAKETQKKTAQSELRTFLVVHSRGLYRSKILDTEHLASWLCELSMYLVA
jgi:hypothetical protein